MTDMLRLTKEEKKSYFLEMILSFAVRVTPKKKHKFVFHVGTGANQHVVCRKGFIKAYTLSRWYLDDVIHRYKCGHKATELNEKTSIPASVVSDGAISAFAEEFGIRLTPEHLGNLRMADSVNTKLTVSWMTYYFSLVGDHVPNSFNEIHLEPIPRSDVYKEFCFNMEHIGDGTGAVSLDVFRKIWKEVFPHVRIRKYKSSCGHCNLCSILSEKRRKFRDKKGREEITNLFALHRLSTMGERRTYYDRRLEAELNPTMFLSTIADGMQQNHCMLPWYGNSKQPSSHVKQHLQGVYMHGDNVTIYRTFANVGGGANLGIHTWLLSLEDYARRHELPRVLQKCGPENANVEFLAVCTLLVVMGVFDKVVLTRLPVGHTHEDIDAIFALIWKRLRDEHIYTPSEFADLVCEVLKKKTNVNVVDIYAVPDYVALFKDCIDSGVGRFAKEEWAQLQFIFEAVDISDEYPIGVKSTYRSYTQDSYIEIVETDDPELSVSGLNPQECLVRARPLAGEAPLNILKRLPSSNICPAPFIAGSRQLLESVANRMICHYTKNRLAVAEEWDMWVNEFAPQSDNVQDYLTRACGVVPAASHGEQFILSPASEIGLYVPFRNQLFGASDMSECDVGPRLRGIRGQYQPVASRGMRVVESTTCVLHSEHKNAAAKRIPSRVVLLEQDGQAPAEPKSSLNNVYPGREARREATRERHAAAKRARDAKEEKQEPPPPVADAKHSDVVVVPAVEEKQEPPHPVADAKHSDVVVVPAVEEKQEPPPPAADAKHSDVVVVPAVEEKQEPPHPVADAKHSDVVVVPAVEEKQEPPPIPLLLMRNILMLWWCLLLKRSRSPLRSPCC
jgi:hypothetical protein